MESFLIRNTFGHKLYELYKLSTNLIERFYFRKEKQILRKKG